jgi:hypothetical protein
MTRMRPSPAMVVAFVALVVSVTTGAYAAVRITTRDIANGAVTNRTLARNSVWHANIGRRSVKAINLANDAVNNRTLARNSVWHANIGTGSVQANNLSRQLVTEIKGSVGLQGPAGPPGANGANGANPGVPVVNVPPVTPGEDGAGGPNSGQAGDQGFYFSGLDANGSARLAGGQLVLHGVGLSNAPTPPQGAIGIAKAFSSVRLGKLDALSYIWHVNTPHGNHAPTIHITVTGLTQDSRFDNGFANLVFTPSVNHITVHRGQQYQSDGFATGARWSSTTAPVAGAPGSSGNPQPLSFFVGRNPDAVISQISLNNGGSSGANGSFAAGADDLILGFAGSRFTRYDFDA